MDYNLLIILSLGLVIIITGIMAVESKELMHAVFFLGVLLVVIGELYIILGGEFVGVVQILIYAGGVTVLMLFTLMFIPKTKDRMEKPFMRIPALITVLLLFTLILTSIGYVSGITTGSIINPNAIAESINTGYLPLVGIVGIIIFIVMISSAYISSVRRE